MDGDGIGIALDPTVSLALVIIVGTCFAIVMAIAATAMVVRMLAWRRDKGD